jgi:hypothetical protein
MIRAVHISGFRGIRECVAEGLGRVNLVIGKNDCGKTAFLEALQLADGPRDAAYHLLQVQGDRLGRAVKRRNFERFWRPLFFDFDAKTGLSVWITRQGGATEKLEIRQGEVPDEAVFSDADGQSILDEDAYDASVKLPTWALDLEVIAPRILTRPWKTTRFFYRQRARKYDIVEGVCIQGFYAERKDSQGNAVFVPIPHADGNPVAQPARSQP